MARGKAADRGRLTPIEPGDLTYCCDLLCSGVDPILSRHVAHLFTRDPLVMFEGSVHVDDTSTTEHFENIQSTNWQTVRMPEGIV